MSLSRGDRLDRYEVIELLGSGGMGEVYRAHDPKLARDVALKVLRVDPAVDTNGAARLLREARAVAALSHANVLAVFDVGEVQEPESLRGLAYIAMELVVGRSLRSYLGDGSVPLARRIDWLRDIARALGAAHEAGIVHRDVKAENVMIRSDGVVKVLDFGIARRAAGAFDAWSSTEGHSLPAADTARVHATLQTLTRQGAVVGTPFYMAPEQLRGEELDARADQFGWGVVAYWLLTERPPWTVGAESVSLLSEILSWDPPSPAERDPRVPGAVSRVIVRALAKQREARFPSMTALIEALDARDGTVTSAPTRTMELVPSLGEGRSVEPPRGRVVRALLVAAVVASGCIGALVWRERGRGARLGATTAAVSATAPVGECVTNADCVHAHGGGAWHCHSGRHACVDLASEDCKVYSEPGDPEADDVVWLGGMFPLSTDPLVLSEMRATELARQEFAAALGRSAGARGASHARPIGLVVCDEGVDAMRAAHHLADDVEVPAVIGFRSAKLASETIPAVFLPRDVLSMISISQDPSLTRIPETPDAPRLIWRTTLNRAEFAPPLAAFISDVIEPAARSGPSGIGDRPLRVAAVWAKAATHDTVEALFDALHFNRRSALENGSNFRQFVYENGADGGALDVVDGLVGFSPQVIIFQGTGFSPQVLTPLEAAWGNGAHGPRPLYLTASNFVPSTIDVAGRGASVRHRLFAVTNRSATRTNAKLVLRYNAAFPGEPVTEAGAPQPSYDAFYLLAYAAYALGDASVAGIALSRSIERLLPPGLSVDVGPSQIGPAFEILRSGGRIDLNGAIGTLDFDKDTGEAPIEYALICPGVDDHGRASDGIDSGLFYDPRAKRLIGKLHCP